MTDCKITVKGNLALIEGMFPIDVVRKATSYYVDGFMFSPAYKARKWDGRKHLFKLGTNTMPAGLVPIVKTALAKNDRKSKIKVVDVRGEGPVLGNHGFELEGIDFGKGDFDYQMECAETLIEMRRGVAKIATNGGKTEIACAVTKHLALPTLFLVERLELLKQTRKRFAKRLNIDVDSIGMVGDGVLTIGKWITVATPASLKSAFKKIQLDPKFWQVVWCDECHHVGSDTFYDVLESLPAYYRFGLSGTPMDRSDGADLRLIAQTGPVVYEVSNKLLVERGISVPPHVEMIKIDKPILPESMKWNQAEKAGIIENSYLNDTIVEKALEHVNKDNQVLILVQKKKQGQILDRLFLNRVNRKFITGDEDTDYREEVLEEFSAGKIRVLIATTILDEGVDVPCIDTLILAAGGKAKIKLLQRVGRGLRQGKNKDKLHVIDFANFTHKYLLKHSLQRLRLYKKEECFTITAS